MATLLENDELDYEHPTEIQKYKYEGNMYYLTSDQVDLCVTPNHKMWVAGRSVHGKQYKLEKAENIIGKRKFYQKNVRQYRDEETRDDFFILPAYKDYPERKLKMNSWLIFFGIWMAEGYVEKTSVKFAAYKPRVREALTLACDIMGFEISKCYDKKTHTEPYSWRFNDAQLRDFMAPYSVGVVNKSLPKWVWDLTTEQARWLIEGMMLGDGHWMKNGTRRYDTSSKQLADDFQRLCLHAGWSCNRIIKYLAGHNAGTVNGRDIISTADAYRLTIIEAQNNPLVNGKKLRHDKWIDYKGYVYCCTVSSGVIYVRRNFVTVFCGNSRNGQKATCGIKPHRADMPFTESGLVPDIIINPNCIPKRMTIGQLIECLLGKLCAVKGVYGDATPFTGVDINKINDELVALGYTAWGNEVMYCGITGNKMKIPIFFGPTYYQRLRQMVGDKAHSRARGPMQLLTKQPPEGRTRDGGLRIGEMERDAMCAHGCACFIKEKMVDNSDIYTAHVCDICGLFAHKVPNRLTRYYMCHACNNTTKISRISIPYAFKLLIQELRSINILARIRTSKSIITPKS